MTEGRALTRLVILDGVVWPAGSVPPATVAERIRNPKCWEPVEETLRLPEAGPGTGAVIPAEAAKSIPNLDEKAGDSPVVAGQPGLSIGQDTAEASSQESSDPAGARAKPAEAEPPRSGRGASENAWRTFAASKGVEVANDADRATIIAACRDAGVIQ